MVLRKWTVLLLSSALALALAACGGANTAGSKEAEASATEAAGSGAEESTGASGEDAESSGEEAEDAGESTGASGEDGSGAGKGEWSLEGYFTDENENFVSIIWMDDSDMDMHGWYVGCVLGEDFTEDSWGGIVEPEGETLHGTIPTFGSRGDITVTVTKEGEGGIVLSVEDGETYHLAEQEIPDATIFVTINVEGMGRIAYAEGEEVPEIDPEFPFQSAVINLAEPEVHTVVAQPEAGYLFVKWQKNGEDFTTEPQFPELLDESADYVAVFEEDPDWQNPVMNFVGNYACGDLNATVECFGNEDAWITIEQGTGGAVGAAGPADGKIVHWDLIGRLDTETLTVEYSGCPKSVVTYDKDGFIDTQEPEYEDGSGTITFSEDGSFTWHDDKSEDGEDLVFKWAAPAE